MGFGRVSIVYGIAVAMVVTLARAGDAGDVVGWRWGRLFDEHPRLDGSQSVEREAVADIDRRTTIHIGSSPDGAEGRYVRMYGLGEGDVDVLGLVLLDEKKDLASVTLEYPASTPLGKESTVKRESAEIPFRLADCLRQVAELKDRSMPTHKRPEVHHGNPQLYLLSYERSERPLVLWCLLCEEDPIVRAWQRTIEAIRAKAKDRDRMLTGAKAVCEEVERSLRYGQALTMGEEP